MVWHLTVNQAKAKAHPQVRVLPPQLNTKKGMNMEQKGVRRLGNFDEDLGRPCYSDPDIWIEEAIDDVCDGDMCCAKTGGWGNCPYGGLFVVTPETLAKRKPK